MKTTRRFTKIVSRPTTRLALAAVVGCGLAVTLLAAEPAADTKKTAPAPKKLTGAELYAINCNRCHQERYPTEFTSAQWQTLITHMRVRANLPAKQAKEILKYLKEEAGG
jgi:mono/diheme cytochrome c family protein